MTPRHLHLKNGVVEIARIIKQCELEHIFYPIVTKDEINPLNQVRTSIPAFFRNIDL